MCLFVAKSLDEPVTKESVGTGDKILDGDIWWWSFDDYFLFLIHEVIFFKWVCIWTVYDYWIIENT